VHHCGIIKSALILLMHSTNMKIINPIIGLHGVHTDNMTTKRTTWCTDTEHFIKSAINDLMYVTIHHSTGKMSPHALFPE
jgi:hypothetical protein